jgi:asparagine synthase (glutamine-hydrolysing)
MATHPMSLVRNKHSAPRSAPAVDFAIGPEYGWRCASEGAMTVWAKGYGRGADAKTLAREFAQLRKLDAAALGQMLNGLDGHFAIAVSGPDYAFAAVDWVRSIPLAFGRCGDRWLIADQALRLRDLAKLGQDDIDPDAALAIAMSGYTIDLATLYRGLHQLGPGEFILFTEGKEPQCNRYYCYRPWRDDKPIYNADRAKAELRDVTLHIIDTMMKGLDGRELVVPLSAGRDSRLIVSAAHQLGYRNVRCFAYGRPGNFEAEASKAIADRLGFPWRFVPTGVGLMRRYFKSEIHRRYVAFSDTAQSAPFVQDLPQVQTLKDDGFISSDAVLCNGNSGDYISGAHIVPAMQRKSIDPSFDARMRRIVDALTDKHFALWRNLATPTNRMRIADALRNSIARAGATLGPPDDDYGLYEYAEFQDRQCKYVITGQRIYEFLGHEWRLPLWAKPYLDFWERVSLAGKVKQNLYAAMLDEQNWGGVWNRMPVNAKTIKPDWIRPIRFAAKVAHSPLGRERWHQFERRYFQYWMSATGASACVPYWRAIRDSGGARHGVAWLARSYLDRHGVTVS